MAAGSVSKIDRLEEYLRIHGAHHPDVYIAESLLSGLHWRAKEDGGISAGSTVISLPHTLAFSYLNALVDDDWPFKALRSRFRADFEVEAISFLYLITQYINREESFWKPYLDALPGPDEDHTQPLFYDDPQDIAWLQGTDVWHTNEKRIKRYKEIYEDAKRVLQEAGHDQSWYTWDLFKWAAATFTSRSFSSRALRPHDSKYWAAYRQGKDGRSQTVLIDMSHASAFDFPVLFPGLDIGNHSNDAKIDYIFDPGRFDIKTNTATRAGEEVFNNYGPKSNDELLLGYGFCIPHNPHNTVSLMLKTPPQKLQDELRTVHPGYFSASEGDNVLQWDTEKTTFQLSTPGDMANPDKIFDQLPEALLELLVYVLHHERGYPFEFVEHPREYLASSEGSRYLPHIANIMMQSFLAKLDKLGTVGEPANARQREAAIYRSGQKDIMISLIKSLQTYLSSLIAPDPSAVPQRSCLVRLETYLKVCERENIIPGFMDRIEANTNTRDVEQLRLAGWEQDIWVLLLTAVGLSDPQALSWLSAYVETTVQAAEGSMQNGDDAAGDLMDIVKQAASPGTVWDSGAWSAGTICEYAKILEYDSFLCGAEPRLHVYLHQSARS